FVCVLKNFIEDQVRIFGIDSHADIFFISWPPHPRKNTEKIDRCFNMVHHRPRRSRIRFFDVGEDGLKLRKSTRAVRDPHPLRYRSNTAATSLSLATSPRSTSANAARISARSSSLNRYTLLSSLSIARRTRAASSCRSSGQVRTRSRMLSICALFMGGCYHIHVGTSSSRRITRLRLSCALHFAAKNRVSACPPPSQ